MQPRIAVIGAGIAGLACAARLRQARLGAEVFDKSQAPGGRAATRRRGGPAFDHGAPGFIARDPRFAAALDGWTAQGAAARWPAADALLGGSAWTGLPGMRDLTRPMLAGLSPRLGSRITALRRETAGWMLELGDCGAAGPFAAVALAVPAPQASGLLGPHAPAFPALRQVRMTPCWTVMVASDTPSPAPGPVLEGDGAPLACAIAGHAKPGREPAPAAWVLHAGADWSAAHLEEPAEDAGRALLAGLARLTGSRLTEPRSLMVHRWRFARTLRGAGADCLWDGALCLGLAGDWCRGSGAALGIEDAWLSGTALGTRIAGELREPERLRQP